jgi:Zn-dependent peptidase ImmA (M78 family)/DNA-binding XRE family transcriptional regulator
MAFGNRLKLARLRAGLSLAALAERLDNKVSAQAINKYETGKMMPSSGVLVSLAKALGVSLDFLMSSQVASLEGVEFRRRASASEREKAFVESEVIDHVERYLAIEEILDIPPSPSALDEIEPVIIDDADDAEEEAIKLRKNWDLGSDPIPSMTALLEDKNVRVIEIGLPDKFSGVTCRVKRGGNRKDVPVIVYNSINVERNRFTLAHELAHAVVKDARNIKAEKAMDRFAGAFLVPATHLKNEVGEERRALAYQELVRLKHLYGVSMWALLHRLKDAGIISEASLKNLFRTPARAWLKDEPLPLSPNGEIAKLEKPQRFENYVYRALAEGLIPANKAANLVKKPLADVERAVKGPQ